MSKAPAGSENFYLSNPPARTPLHPLTAIIKARRVCRQAHQQLKEELRPDHFECRSWTGLHRHALIAMTAYAFLKAQRFAGAKGKDAPQDHHLSPASPPSGTPCNSYCLARWGPDIRIVARAASIFSNSYYLFNDIKYVTHS
jgi:hypothetical protein